MFTPQNHDLFILCEKILLWSKEGLITPVLAFPYTAPQTLLSTLPNLHFKKMNFTVLMRETPLAPYVKDINLVMGTYMMHMGDIIRSAILYVKGIMN